MDGENLDYNFINRKRRNRYFIRLGNREHTKCLRKALTETIDKNEKVMFLLTQLKQRLEDLEKQKHLLLAEIKILTDLITNEFVQGVNNNQNQESSTGLTDNE